jgi:hypothetical protein
MADANELLRSKHAFGNSDGIQAAIDAGKIDAFDILFLDGNTDKPKIGWIDKNGEIVIVQDEKADLSELEAEVATKADAEEVKAELAEKADVSVVDEKIDQAVTDTVATANAYTDEKVEAALAEHLVKKYEIADVPVGTLIDYRENEIRVMCPVDAVFTKQSVGEGGDANSYYATFKTYVPNDNVVGYVEHLGNKVDSEILTNFSIDKYGRRYQPTWLAIAKYDEATGTWNYYGKSSSKNKYIGWDYQIDWYNADGVIIASDSIRINLSNEDCHYSIEPYYVSEIMTEVDEKIEEKIAEVAIAYEIVEF